MLFMVHLYDRSSVTLCIVSRVESTSLHVASTSFLSSLTSPLNFSISEAVKAALQACSLSSLTSPLNFFICSVQFFNPDFSVSNSCFEAAE